MTEATHQMCTNPLPPRVQKPGSVGVPAGPDVRIAHRVRQFAAAGGRDRRNRHQRRQRDAGLRGQSRGQRQLLLCCRGQAVVQDRRPGTVRCRRLSEPHRAPQGNHQPGRRKDQSARGGRRPARPSRDRAGLSASPCLTTSSARTSPRRSSSGKGSGLDERAIRAFAAERLAGFKVPRSVAILDEIPKGATGKIQRIGMAERLGLAG